MRYTAGMRFRLGVGIALAAVGVLAACGGGGGGGGVDADTAGDASESDGAIIDGPPLCNDGDPCDAGTCAGGVCCATDKACGAACCGGAQVCSFQQCVAPGNVCIDATDCAAGEYCEYTLGEPPTVDASPSCIGGALPTTGRCLPRPPQCSSGQPPGDPPTCLEACQYVPPPLREHGQGLTLRAPGRAHLPVRRHHRAR
jgi:hypothetical protein